MIHVLPKHISDKIAAGEVVERPISIVKELVENSIDAGANRIIVEIKNGGKTYLRVTDNGSGIIAEEVTLAFQRHATSKIQDADDLDHIGTLGFRGEALTSIAAVSRTEIITKTATEKTGSRVLFEGGEILEQSGTGCPDGTTIVVKDLFFNTPARRKFLKPDGTESGLIIEFVSQMALAYPTIGFRMINQEQTLFTTPGNGDRLQGIHTLYGRINGGKLLAVESENGQYRLQGYVSDPGETRANRKSQIYFVNGRVISNKTMERALDQAYSQRLFEGRHPIAYLFLEMPAEDLDVNIHPNKREVRFHREQEVEEFVRFSLKNVLQKKESIPVYSTSKARQSGQPEFGVEIVQKALKHEQVDIKSLLSTLRNQQSKIMEESDLIRSTMTKEPISETAGPASLPVDKFHPESLSPMGVAFGTYIVATDEETLYLIDQHAAHERILFEQLMDQLESDQTVHQTLLVPFSVQSNLTESADAHSWMQILRQAGFAIDPFGPNTYIVKEIPGFFEYEEAERFLSDFLDQVSDDTNFTDRNTLIKAASGACKAAVKGNTHLSQEEINTLLVNLSQCENPLSCPHGRPTFIRFPKAEIERKFRRT
jgi:DNA mismatch repair protein MutL